MASFVLKKNQSIQFLCTSFLDTLILRLMPKYDGDI